VAGCSGLHCGQQTRALFGEVLHGPNIVFIAERAKQIFPKRLFPSGAFGAGAKLGGFGFEPRARCLVQKPGQFGFGEVAQGGATFAAEIFGQGTQRFVFEREAQFGERRVEHIFQCQNSHGKFRSVMAGARFRGGGICPGIVPDDVQQHVAEIGIAMVAVGAPAGGAQIDFDISGAWGLGADLQDRAAKIRAAFQIGEARVKNAHILSRERFEFGAAQALVLPNGLDEPFGREPLVAEAIFGEGAGPPLGVKIIGKLNQATLLLEF